MNDLYGDDSNHEACEICGLCIKCKDCECVTKLWYDYKNMN